MSVLLTHSIRDAFSISTEKKTCTRYVPFFGKIPESRLSTRHRSVVQLRNAMLRKDAAPSIRQRPFYVGLGRGRGATTGRGMGQRLDVVVVEGEVVAEGPRLSDFTARLTCLHGAASFCSDDSFSASCRRSCD